MLWQQGTQVKKINNIVYFFYTVTIEKEIFFAQAFLTLHLSQGIPQYE